MLHKLREWFRPTPPVVTPRVVRLRSAYAMTMAEWRSNPDTVKLAIQTLMAPGVPDMLHVLRNSASPHNFALPLEASQEARMVIQARTEGYIACLNDFESMAVLEKPSETIEATYEPPELAKTE